eukprot:Pgem_evm1s18239
MDSEEEGIEMRNLLNDDEDYGEEFGMSDSDDFQDADDSGIFGDRYNRNNYNNGNNDSADKKGWISSIIVAFLLMLSLFGIAFGVVKSIR